MSAGFAARCQAEISCCARFARDAQPCRQPGPWAALPNVHHPCSSDISKATLITFSSLSNQGAGLKTSQRQWPNRTSGSGLSKLYPRKKRTSIGVIQMGIKAVENFNTAFELDSVVGGLMLHDFLNFNF